MAASRSSTMVSCPRCARARATASPITPAPTTTASTRSISGSGVARVEDDQPLDQFAQMRLQPFVALVQFQTGLVHVEPAVDLQLDRMPLHRGVTVAPHQFDPLV